MRFIGSCYRAHDPRWASTPLSGDGAAVHGGRFNPKGTPALYLALSAIGAVKEANQGFAHKIDPFTFCSYDIDCDDIADLTDAKTLADLGIKPNELACAWFAISNSGVEPSSWRIARRLISDGYAGIIVPSFAKAAAPDERNLVLWTWSKALPHLISVSDPSGKLPKNQLSWD